MSRWIVLLLAGFCVVPSVTHADSPELPLALDDRLTIELFASEPDVVTVTGLTVDSQGRVLVVESHTHFRPEDYDGPETDRIRLLEDTDGDGRADRIETFFSGTTQTMNIAAHRNGWVYVATRNLVFRIRDLDGDGRSDERQDLVQFETTSDYPHNGISGFAFDFDGKVYFGLGENMGENGTLIASDTRLAADLGSGGVFRCNEDGSGLQRVAIGFWNPFHLCFDVYGRMFLGDNDPGNRPPCRFLSIVEGGDYGYRRQTLEPFIAVDGEVPGTLPMTSSTGESPTGIVAYESDHLPADYRGDLLVASWGEHRIDRYHLERNGADFQTTSQAVIAGGEHFRPAGIAVAPDGSLYIGDWADRSYPLHGKGRIWHVRAKQPMERSTDRTLHNSDRTIREEVARQLAGNGEAGLAKLTEALDDNDPRVRSVALSALIHAGSVTDSIAKKVLNDPFTAIREQAARTLPDELFSLTQVAQSDPEPSVRAAAMRRISDPDAESLFIGSLSSNDPYLVQAARKGLGQSVSLKRFIALTGDDKDEVRLAAVLLLRGPVSQMPIDPVARDQVLTRALSDRNPDVRFAAVEWIGREQIESFHDRLVDDLATHATTPELFAAYLAAIAQLDGVMEQWGKNKSGDWWMAAADSFQYADSLLSNPSVSPLVLQQVLRFLPEGNRSLSFDTLSRLCEHEEIGVQIDAVVRLRELSGDAATSLLESIALDRSRRIDVRAEAVIGLDASNPQQHQLLMRLTSDPEAAIVAQAVIGLRDATLNETQSGELRELGKSNAAISELVAKTLRTEQPSRPSVTDLDQWLTVLDGPADASAGQRVFFHPKGPGCARCHRIDGRGQAIGPSLVRVDGRIALTRRRLVQSILQPSKDVDPGFMPMTIMTVDGRVASGIYHRHGQGTRSIINAKGEIESFQVSEIEAMRPSTQSIMPDGLVDTMTTQEFRDLLAYLLEPFPRQR
ncbi:PVC-type heme-binding CxxCH protein [Stieleria varia]|uniref:HEAT repeat protein n=2 Tax=Stieleria varia TaxID=2528005 RepID=A0A5C6AX73_9BACT|nr:PVC-type heme-binding CxxCH protein [Stieleria varia]TWU04605.1 HEAT repeat protein [Stieleria varia]